MRNLTTEFILVVMILSVAIAFCTGIIRNDIRRAQAEIQGQLAQLSAKVDSLDPCTYSDASDYYEDIMNALK